MPLCVFFLSNLLNSFLRCFRPLCIPRSAASAKKTKRESVKYLLVDSCQSSPGSEEQTKRAQHSTIEEWRFMVRCRRVVADVE